VEFAMAVLFLISAYRFQASWTRMVLADILSTYLLIISIIDWRHLIIPDELSLSLAAVGLGVSWINPFLLHQGLSGFLESLLAGLSGGLGMIALAWVGEKLFRKEALGGGDIKLVAAFGAFLGWGGILGSLLWGSLLGGITGIGLILLHKKKRNETIPFGPFLSLGAYAACQLPPGWLRFIFP
jgi:leader peptidase (prepilin peptidase)/N-methyltransferase